MKTNSILRSCSFFAAILVCFAVFSVLSCKKSGDEKTIVKTSHPLDGTIVASLPQNTTGIFYWNSSSGAFKAFQTSQWSTSSSSSLFDMSSISHPVVKEFVEALKANGIDPQKNETIENLFSEGVAFVGTNTDSVEEPLTLGVVIKAKDQQLVSSLAESIKKGLEAQGKTVSPVDISTGKAVQFAVQMDIDDPTSSKEIFLGWQKDLAILSTKKADVATILAGGQGSLPQALNTDSFQRSIKQFPAQKIQYGFGYIDLQAIVKVLQNPASNNQAQSLNELPIEAAAIALGMRSAPFSEARILFSPKNESQKQLFNNIKQSTSGELLKVLSAEPMLFVSLDGETIKNAKENYLKKEGTDVPQELALQLEVLNNIKRLGIYAKNAPIGQAMLPIPDLMVLFETSDGAKLNDTLIQLLGGLMAQGPTPTSWQSKKIDGQEVKYFLTPLGVGVYLTVTPNLLIAASSEGQIKTAIATAKNGTGAFMNSITNDAKPAFAEDGSCANIYLNFKQLSSLLQNLGGMAQMYAAQNPQLQKMLEPKQLDSLRKLGGMVASITVEEGAVVVKSSYLVTETKPN